MKKISLGIYNIRQSGWTEKACYGGQEADGDGKYSLDRHGFKFTTVCAYCKAVMSWEVDRSLDRDKISHGICTTCNKIENDKLDKKEINL